MYKNTSILEMEIPHPVLEPIDQETALTIEQRFVGIFLSGSDDDRPVSIRTDKIRHYPHNELLCHLIGQMAPLPGLHNTRSNYPKPTTQQLKDYYLDDRQGDWGVEKMFESRLRGSRG